MSRTARRQSTKNKVARRQTLIAYYKNFRNGNNAFNRKH